MSKIRLLDDTVINKIAAGEVVGNPASVLKELVENSIDADSTSITVNIAQSGMGMLRVADNGEGMIREDATRAIERHATSKLTSDKDLLSLSTLGFRGEALPSIAAVSKFLLRTSNASEMMGTRVRIDGGKLISVSDDSIATGTIIEIKNLFFNVPARKKFIRSFHAEKMALSQIFIRIALANPGIDFSLVDDGKEIYRLLKTDSLINRIASVFGRDFTADLIEVKNDTDTFTVSGYVSHPQLCRSTRSGQYLFVNNRVVHSTQISNAVRQAYGSLLPAGRYPIFVLNLSLDPARIDVNVHPTKKEIKFTHIHKIEDTIERTVEKYLKESKLIFDIRTQKSELAKINLSYNVPRFSQMQSTDSKQSMATEPLQPESKKMSDETISPYTSELPKAQVIKRTEIVSSGDMFLNQLDAVLQQENSEETHHADAPIPQETAGEQTAEEVDIIEVKEGLGASGIRVVGQIGKCFIVGESQDGLIIIDQHAAHERVNFEKVLRSIQNNTADSQELLFPITYTVDSVKKHIVLSKRDLLRKAGVSVEEFGVDMLVVTALPRYISPTSIKAVLEDLVEESRNDASQSIENWQLKLAKMVACRSSVKAADKLELRELQQLIDDLYSCDTPYTCPHGRPTIIRMNYAELRKHFQRE